MAISAATQDAVRALWVVGSDHGRAPSPTPEADPWVDEDPIDVPQDTAVVDFPGIPAISVRLDGTHPERGNRSAELREGYL